MTHCVSQCLSQGALQSVQPVGLAPKLVIWTTCWSADANEPIANIKRSQIPNISKHKTRPVKEVREATLFDGKALVNENLEWSIWNGELGFEKPPQSEET